jgi:hypothetical protein
VALADRGDQARDAVGAPQRRRATPEIDRDQPAREPRSARRELAEDGVEVLLVRGLADLDREVAVRA